MKFTAVFAVIAACCIGIGFTHRATAAPENSDTTDSSLTGIATKPVTKPLLLPEKQGPELQQELQEQRSSYQKALQALRNGNSREFRQLLTSLRDYPLKPYLEYADISARLSKLPYREVDHFLSQHQGQRIADTLRLRWLKVLKQRRRGSDFIRYYQSGLSNTKLACYYQYARYRTGDQTQQQTALQHALKLWQVGKSQPRECDQLFDLLEDSGNITDKLRWQRYSKALSNRQYQLARYLQKRIKQQPYASWAANASAASKNPELIANYRNFSDQSPETLAVIEHNLRPLE